MLDQLYAHLGTRNIPGEPEALERLAMRVKQLATINGEDWVRSNRRALLFQWQMAIQHTAGEEAAAQEEEEIDA